LAERGLIEGIMDFLRILEGMEKEGQTEKTDEGKFGSGDFTGSYACRIRIGLMPSDYGINTDGKNKREKTENYRANRGGRNENRFRADKGFQSGQSPGCKI